MSLPLFTLAILIFLQLQAINAEIHWAYQGTYGPSVWSKYFPGCGGKEQSPVDISLRDTEEKKFPPFKFEKYDKATGEFKVKNNGHSIEVEIPYDDQVVSGGGLRGKYQPTQFHFHWGAINARGSEHLVNGKPYPLEMHIVHANSKYTKSAQVLGNKDGLAVLGVFFKIGKPNRALAELFQIAGKLSKQDANDKIRAIALADLLPKVTDRFFRYQGSLTTPKCNEAVTWTLFEEPLTVSGEQMAELRRMFTDKTGKIPMVDNYRPVQQLFVRKIYQSSK